MVARGGPRVVPRGGRGGGTRVIPAADQGGSRRETSIILGKKARGIPGGRQGPFKRETGRFVSAWFEYAVHLRA